MEKRDVVVEIPTIVMKAMKTSVMENNKVTGQKIRMVNQNHTLLTSFYIEIASSYSLLSYQ
jgi:hypothetical protein